MFVSLDENICLKPLWVFAYPSKGIAQWLEQVTADQHIAGLSPLS